MQNVVTAFMTAAMVAALPAFGTHGSRSSLKPASAEIELLIRQSLEDRLAADDLPDKNLLGGSTRIALREEMPQAGMTLGPRALPQREGYQFSLVSAAAAQEDADRTRQTVAFITVDNPSIVGDTATMTIGVDAAFPRDPNMIRLCCCTGQAQFHRSDDRWRFVKWGGMMCS